MLKVLLFYWLAQTGLMILLLVARYQLEATRGDLEIARREAEAA
jgi:hypothetical protein